MIHSKNSKPCVLLAVVFLFLPCALKGQTLSQKSNNSIHSFRLNLSLPTHYEPQSNSSFQNDLEQDLFSNNFILGVEADYFLSKKWVATPAITFLYSKAEQTNGLVFVMPPPGDTITIFETDYTFFSASLEPKIKLVLPYSNAVNFFWSAGPIISYGSLSSQTDGAPYENPDRFRPVSRSSSKSFGYGFTAAAGLQIDFTTHFALSLEAGYRFADFATLSLEDPINSDARNSYNYRLRSFSPGLGIVYQL